MRAAEILVELGNAPASFEVVDKNDEIYHARSDELELDFYLTNTLDGIDIEFLVNSRYSITNTGNAIKIFSTVKNMLVQSLDDFLSSEDKHINFSADLTEPSRVKLYQRMVPIISEILGSEWKFINKRPGKYTWERVAEPLNEKPVESAWISDLIYNRPNKILTMRLSNGISYSIPGIGRATFEQWLKAPSKGYFFHDRIKDTYNVNKI